MLGNEKKEEVSLTGNQMAEIVKQEKLKAKELSRQASQMHAIINEINGSIQAVKAVQGKKGLQIIVPLGAGISLDAIIESAEKIKTTIPGNIIVEKTPKEAIEMLESQATAVKKEIELLKGEILQASNKIREFSKVMKLAQSQFSRQNAQSK
ncbi:MAG: hypothetical protein Q7R70_06810 [Candidatus Diapherotrites archaeon]|nr:hypothetical protein [Candidatus Diapherotrites archaeon]